MLHFHLYYALAFSSTPDSTQKKKDLKPEGKKYSAKGSEQLGLSWRKLNQSLRGHQKYNTSYSVPVQSNWIFPAEQLLLHLFYCRLVCPEPPCEELDKNVTGSIRRRHVLRDTDFLLFSAVLDRTLATASLCNMIR